MKRSDTPISYISKKGQFLVSHTAFGAPHTRNHTKLTQIWGKGLFFSRSLKQRWVSLVLSLQPRRSYPRAHTRRQKRWSALWLDLHEWTGLPVHLRLDPTSPAHPRAQREEEEICSCPRDPVNRPVSPPPRFSSLSPTPFFP